MFPTFIGILDIQSWWEVPSIAHFCSLFRDAFNLLDFDIEDLEEALLTDSGTEGHLLQELIVRLLEGCLPDETRNDISTFNYQMFLRRLFRKKCQEFKCENPFNTDVDFELLPLRQKVEILRALCDFRLDAEDVEESLSDLDSDSLRVEPLGHDRKNSAYWYFYGTRLYREDYIDTSNTVSQKQKGKPKYKKHRRRRGRLAKAEKEEEEKEEAYPIYGSEYKERESIWQVVCFTLQDWSRLVEKFKDSDHATERKLYKTLSEDFMPEIPKLFDLKERQQRRRILQRISARTVQSRENENIDEPTMVKSKIKTKSSKGAKKSATSQTSKNVKVEEEVVPPPVPKKGRQTNNSLASAVGQILIDTSDDVTDVENKKGSGKHGSSVSSGYGYGYNFGIEEEEQQVGMHKVLKILKDHEDAWPFTDPVDEQYAPRYYSVVRRPMDLSRMEDKLDEGSYKTISQFKRDFHLIIENCRQYNGSDNEYTEMAMNLKEVFNRAVDRYLEFEQSSDDSLSVSSGAGVNSPGYKNKNSSPSAIRHSQRHKHPGKLSKKSKISSKMNKKKAKHDDSAKEESEVETKPVKVKDKKGRKKSKKNKNEVKVEESEEEQENEGAISDANVIKTKKKKSGDNDQTASKNKKALVKEEIEQDPIKSNKKVKKELKQDKISSPVKEFKENRKRKDDFEEDYKLSSIPKSKSRKIEKKENKELDVLVDKVKKSKVKKEESQETSTKEEEEEKIPPPVEKGKKNRKVNKEKLELPNKNKEKEKDKKSKKKSDELLKNGELKQESDVKSDGNITDTNKSVVKKFESLDTKKDIDSLDSLKDRISERRRKEKLKLEQEKKKKKSLNSDAVLGTSKKVPSNGSTYHHDVDKLGGKKLKSKKVSKEEKSNNESKSQNQEESEPKKIKLSHSKHTKGSGRGDPAIQALNQATEQTLNDINKWLDDAPKVTEFSSGSDSPVLHASTSDSSARPSTNKQAALTTDPMSRKRPSSIKLFGPNAPLRPKKVQRTIDRLQPGKSKGNLLSKKPPSNESAPTNETTVNQSTVDKDESNRESSDEPKLSLGTVLKNVDSIQLICKSLVSSPNPNLSNDDDDEESGSKPATPLGSVIDDSLISKKTSALATLAKEKKGKRNDNGEVQKPKSATPNLSAWFKAFGAPKSKKKEEEEEPSKKEEIPESSSFGIGNRQRRVSTGGSSVSESVSSFSQESPPSRTGRSPQQSQQLPSVLPSPASMEPQIRGAGFYQDALSTGGSPYQSPFYTTPPRYSAQLPPTPSPQNHALSPAYPSSAAFDQAQAAPPSLYSQINSQSSHQSFQKPSPQAQSPTISQQSPQNCFPQNSPQSEQSQQSYPAPALAASQSQSPVYPQQSPRSLQSSPYPQPSPQPANYSQPSPQTQPPTPGYSQPSPQAPASNYSQPSPSQTASLNFSQSSPQQQHSPYSQSSPQPPPSYSQPSPQSQQHSPYSQPSPQQPYSQVSPRPPSSTYSQPSPQPPGYSAQTPSPYSQSDLVIAQPSPRGYSQSSPQTPSPYSAQASPQQQPPTYSQPSPQTPPSYSQPSPQQSRAFSHPSPQQTSQSAGTTQQPQQPQLISNYSQPSPQQQSQQQQATVSAVSAGFSKSAEDYSQNLSTSPFTQPLKSYLQSSATPTPIAKPAATKEKSQHQNAEHLAALNQQVYQSAAGTQYPPSYPGTVFSSTDRVGNSLTNELSARSAVSRLTNHETQQQLAQQRQVQQSQQEQQSSLLSFQQNLASHESFYTSGFQGTPYPMPSAPCRPVYPGYFDASAKSSTGAPSPSSSLAPVKKRMYSDPSATADAVTQRASSQEQFTFDSLMALAHSQAEVSVSNQFDSAFASSLADTVASNPAYARLQLGLVGRNAKETQQLLSIPRPSSKNDPLAAYTRTGASEQPELDLNLLQSLQNAAKGSSMLSMSRRVTEQAPPIQSASTNKSKKSKKNKQQQQQQQQQLNAAVDQQTSIPGFPQYGTASDPIGLKQATVGGSAFNFAASAGANSSAFYDKEASASAAAAAYAFLDDFRNPNLPSYYSMALRQQQQQQAVQQQQQPQQSAAPVTDAAQQACNKLTNQTAARNFASHPFLHSAQRPNPYGPPVPPYVTPHGTNLGVDPAAYQQYLHSLYALQPPPHHRPTWL